jgi:spermidine/putrescine transport system permease protein
MMQCRDELCLETLPEESVNMAGLAFIQSFENYNTTLFAIGIQQTLPIYIGTQLRVFTSPAMNALGVIIILLTLAGAVVYEVVRQKEITR